MDPVNTTDSCLVVEETTLFVDAAAVARRKRMEIRRFKQMAIASKSTYPQGINKRSRPNCAGNCELCDTEDDTYVVCHKSEAEGPSCSQFLADTEGKAGFGHAIMPAGSSLFKSGGLIRSKSFPPEGWHKSSSSQCVFKLCKTSHTCTATEAEGLVVTVVDDELCNTVKGKQHGLCATLTMEVSRSSASPPLTLTAANLEGEPVRQHQRTEISSNVRENDDCSSLKPGDVVDARSEGPSTHNVVSIGSHPVRRNDGTVDASIRESSDQPKGLSTINCSSGVSEISSCSDRCFSDGKCPPSGKLLVCGRRREMEDTAAVVPSFTSLPCDAVGGCQCGITSDKRVFSDFHFFAVYDGHGGSQASRYCAERFHHVLGDGISLACCESDSGEVWDSKWKTVLYSSFMKMDRDVGGVCPNSECDDGDGSCTCCEDAIAPENVGTTAVVAIVGPCQIIIGNCGDSRAVLSRGGKAIPLSADHKPEREDENSRIEAAGGRVIYWDGYRVGGLLALSRALGDRYLKRYVISEPEVTCTQRTEEDECLILASDGLWDVISNEVACEVARKSLATTWRKCEYGSSPPGEDSAAAQVAALLVKLAYGRGSKDNISVVVVDLKGRSR